MQAFWLPDPTRIGRAVAVLPETAVLCMIRPDASIWSLLPGTSMIVKETDTDTLIPTK